MRTKIGAFLLALLCLNSCSTPKNVETMSKEKFDSIESDSIWRGNEIAPWILYNNEQKKQNCGKLFEGVFYWNNREYVNDGFIFDINMPEIVEGDYYFTDGNGYIRMKDNGFQICDLDEERIEQLNQFYKNSSSNVIINQHDTFSEKPYTTEEINEIKENVENSNQIEDELINQNAKYYINPLPTMDFGTDIELTYNLSDYQMYFPLLYFYRDEHKLVFIDLEWEFKLKE